MQSIGFANENQSQTIDKILSVISFIYKVTNVSVALILEVQRKYREAGLH